jgi:hypothetical protein
MAEQPVPMGMLRPETSTPMRDWTSEATPGELEFSTHWPRRGRGHDGGGDEGEGKELGEHGGGGSAEAGC